LPSTATIVSCDNVRAIRSAGYRSLTIARETTMPVAVPNAWMPRPAISQPRLGARMLSSAPASMIEMPPSTATRRP